MTTCEVPDLFFKNNTAANILRSSEKESVKEKLVLFQHFPNLSIHQSLMRAIRHIVFIAAEMHTHTHIRYMFTGMVYIIVCNLQKMFFCKRYRNGVVSDRKRKPFKIFQRYEGKKHSEPKTILLKMDYDELHESMSRSKEKHSMQHLHIHQ